MSPVLLEEELSDISEVLMVHDLNQVHRKIPDTRTGHKKLRDIFKLGEVEKHMLQH